jgi:alkylation response protein AidB-like acyl-CoA dehydrogenase
MTVPDNLPASPPWVEQPARTWTGPYPVARELDLALGDPRDPSSGCGFAAAVGLDEARMFPRSLAGSAGGRLRLSFVPRRYGGELTTMDETLTMVRVAARRDVTVMPATMFSITAACCVLIAGTDTQRDQVVRTLRNGGSVGFALAEAEHGADLLANDCRLTELADGSWALDGEKWMVGTGPRLSALLVIAHSGGRGPGAYSSVLVPETELGPARGQSTERPTGMRGIDFARLSFANTTVPSQARVGALGHGLDTAMRAMQLVRSVSSAANLACADSGLRLTLDTVAGRTTAGRPALRQQEVRRELGTAAAALLAADAVALTCARGLHALPAEQSVVSSVAKKVLTDLSAQVFDRCADALGPASMFHTGPGAAFEVFRRDNDTVRYIDTEPDPNRRLVSMQLGQVARRAATAQGEFGVASPELVATYTLGAPLPEFAPERLALSAKGKDAVTVLLPATATGVRSALDPAAPQGVLLTTLLDRLETELSVTGQAVLRCLDKTERADTASRAAELADLTDRFCFLHAAASCVHLWWFNRAQPLYGQQPGCTGWLVAALTLLLDRAAGRVCRLEPATAEPGCAIAESLHAAGLLFSAVAMPLSEATGAGNVEDTVRSW